MNVMQIMHGAYNMQNYHDNDNIGLLWTYFDDGTANAKFNKLGEPVLTRWWLVG